MAGVNGVGWHFTGPPWNTWAFTIGARRYPTALCPWPSFALAPVVAIHAPVFGRPGGRRPKAAIMARAGRPPGLRRPDRYFHWLGRDPWTAPWDTHGTNSSSANGLLHWSPPRKPGHHLLPQPPAAAARAPGRGRRLSSGGRRVSALHAYEARASARESHWFMQSRPLNSSANWAGRSMPCTDPRFTSSPAPTPTPLYKRRHVRPVRASLPQRLVRQANPILPPRLHGRPKPVAASRRHAGIMIGTAPFDEPLRRLPCVSAVDLRKASSSHRQPRRRREQSGGGPAVHVGSGATTIQL